MRVLLCCCFLLLSVGAEAGVAQLRSEWAPGASCRGPGVWPHPSHCSLFSVCRETAAGVVRGALLRCPKDTAFVSRRWSCLPDQYTRCAFRPMDRGLLEASAEVRVPSPSSRLGLCPLPRPYCSSPATLTVCAPNRLLVGHVTCSSRCAEDEFGASCGDDGDPGAAEAPPLLDASLIDSAIKITSSLGLGPNTSGGTSTTRRPGLPAHHAPVFDLNASPEEYYSYEEEKLEREKSERERLEREKLEREKMEKEKLEREKLEREKLEREKMEREKLEKEKLEREKMEREKMEKEKLEREKMEREKMEKEKLEREKLEREKLEREKLEKEKLEREKMEREKLEKEKLEREKMEREKLEKEKLEREMLERVKLEKEKLEREKLEREKLNREMLERVKLEKEKLEREKLEREKLDREMLERVKLEKEKLEREKLEREKLEREKSEREKLERENLEKEKLEREKLERENLEKEKLEREKLGNERLEMERIEQERLDNERRKEQEKLEAEENASSTASVSEHTQETTSSFALHDLATACRRPGLTCVNANVILECSADLVPLRAWNCDSFFSSALGARCDRERDSCVAAVGGEGEEEEESPPLCEKPGARCADSATLIHCSDDLRSATVAVCADLFRGVTGAAVCDRSLDACVVGIGGDEEYRPAETTTPGALLGSHPPSSIQSAERFPGKPHPSEDPGETHLALFPTEDECGKPGLRCFGGRVLEACERGNPRPVYRMDCAVVLADSLGARCEERNEGEATCVVSLPRRDVLRGGGAALQDDGVFTLELSVVDVTFDSDDSEIPQWRCSRVGQYCADEGTLLSCGADFAMEFALSCGAIAPESVVAFCDHSRDACVVRKISDLISGPVGNASFTNVPEEVQNETSTSNQASALNMPEQYPDKLKPTLSNQEFSDSYTLDSGAEQTGSLVGPTKWDFSTISQLYPPDVPLNSYSTQTLNPQATIKVGVQDSAGSLLKSNCTKAGPVCLDAFHLGSCSEELELRYVLPCSALYTSDPAPYCDYKLSACLPSAAREPTTTTDALTTKIPSTTTTATPTKAPTTMPAATTLQPTTFIPQQIPPYHLYDIPATSGVHFATPPRNPTIQENQFSQSNVPLIGSNIPQYPFLRPGGYTFFHRPGLNGQYQQQSRLPSFLQNILQSYGIRFPSFSQTLRPPTLSSFPLLQNIFQGFSTLRPPATLQQNSEYGLYGGEEPYDYNDPQYQHYAEKYSDAYPPVTYHAILSDSQLVKDVARPVAPLSVGLSPDMHSDILKYYTSMLTAATEQPVNTSPSAGSSNLYKNRLKPPKPVQSYLDRLLEKLQWNSQEQFSQGSHSVDLFKSKLPASSGVGSTAPNSGPIITSRPVLEKVNSPGVVHSSGFQGSISQVNPLTWIGKLEVPDADKTLVCKHPGMQCVDSRSLGACSKDLKLRYVIPCRNLLPFVSIGKPYCDIENDACGVLVEEEQSDYPTDYTSYP